MAVGSISEANNTSRCSDAAPEGLASFHEASNAVPPVGYRDAVSVVSSKAMVYCRCKCVDGDVFSARTKGQRGLRTSRRCSFQTGVAPARTRWSAERRWRRNAKFNLSKDVEQHDGFLKKPPCALCAPNSAFAFFVVFLVIANVTRVLRRSKPKPRKGRESTEPPSFVVTGRPWRAVQIRDTLSDSSHSGVAAADDPSFCNCERPVVMARVSVDGCEEMHGASLLKSC